VTDVPVFGTANALFAEKPRGAASAAAHLYAIRTTEVIGRGALLAVVATTAVGAAHWTASISRITTSAEALAASNAARDKSTGFASASKEQRKGTADACGAFADCVILGAAVLAALATLPTHLGRGGMRSDAGDGQ
jgi:hypothetical protein